MGVSKENQVKKLNKKIMNWASDKEFAEKVTKQILSNLNVLKSAREARETKWREFYDMWSIEHDEGQSYKGRANLYIPQARKEVETMSRRLKKALFPEDYLDATATKFEDSDAAETNKFVMMHFFNVMNMKGVADPWIKQNVLYGTSPLKSYWERREVEQFYRKKYFKEKEKGNFEAAYNIVREQTLLYNAPKARVADIFQTYISPASAQLPSDIREVYENQKVTWQQMKMKERDGCAVNLDEVERQLKEKDTEFSDTQERLASQGDPGEIVGTDKILDLLEWWGELDLPNGQRLPCVVEIVNECVSTRIQQNPLWHQTPPYVFARFIKPPPGEFYGRGIAEAIQHLQYQLNDTINQTVDASTLALNNITIVNPAFAPNVDSFEIEPGAIWWADPNAIKQFVFPDLSDTGLKNANMIRQIMTESSDNSPQLPDPIAGKARSTGQAQLAIDEWQTDLYSFMTSIETEALVPFCGQVHSLLQQYVPDDLIIRVAGKYAETWVKKIVKPEDLSGKYDFTWKGAIQTQNNAIKVQQMLNFIKVASSLPPDAGVKVNWPNLIMKLFRDGLQMKDAHTIIETNDYNPSVAPGMENEMIKMGGPVNINSADDDGLHIQSHEAYASELKEPYAKFKLSLHIAKHNAQIQAKQQAQMIMQQQMAAQQQAQQQPQGRGGANNPMGNQGQINESTNPDDMMKGLRP